MDDRPPRRTKNRRDIGQVVFPIEQLMMARSLSSCCAGQEAMLAKGEQIVDPEKDLGWKPTGAA
jgi:hypothetical protein